MPSVSLIEPQGLKPPPYLFAYAGLKSCRPFQHFLDANGGPTLRTAILSPKTLVEVWQKLLRQADDRNSSARHHRAVGIWRRIHLQHLPGARSLKTQIVRQSVD